MLLRNLADCLLNHVIQDMPDDIGICEFDCRRLQCSQGEWEICERRLNRARGELMPANESLQQRVAEPVRELPGPERE